MMKTVKITFSDGTRDIVCNYGNAMDRIGSRYGVDPDDLVRLNDNDERELIWLDETAAKDDDGSNAVAEIRLTDALVEKPQATCSICVHGHDRDIFAGSPVWCAPQKNVHPANYSCTGFRKITMEELNERTRAKFGTPAGTGD